MVEALPLLIGIVLVGSAAAFALLPLLGGPAGAEPTPLSVDGARAERQALYRQVVELEFDHQTGKLATLDYRALEADLLNRAAALLREHGAEGDDVEQEVEREIAAARSAFAAARSARAVVAASPERSS